MFWFWHILTNRKKKNFYLRISLGDVLHLACFSSNKWHADASWVCRLKGILFDVRLPQHVFLNQSSSGIVRLVFMHKITHFLFFIEYIFSLAPTPPISHRQAKWRPTECFGPCGHGALFVARAGWSSRWCTDVCFSKWEISTKGC